MRRLPLVGRRQPLTSELMSALGPKRKWQDFQNMSAVPPATDIRRGERHVCFVPICDIEANPIRWLFDHLVGATNQRRRQIEAKRFRSLRIDGQLEFGRLIKGDVSRISAFENLIDEVGEAAKSVQKVD